MLGPNFLEGQAPRTAEDPKEIQLPEDSVDGVTLLARFTHCLPTAHNQIESFADIAKMLTGLGVVADKYDCIHAVSMASESIMHRCMNNIPLDTSQILPKDTLYAYARLAAAAYSLDMTFEFAFFTRRLVLDTTASFTEVADIEGCEGLPQSAIMGLEEQRTAVREALVSTIAEGACGKCWCNQLAVRTVYQSELARLLDLPHWPPPWTRYRLASVLRELCAIETLTIGGTLACGHPRSPISERLTFAQLKKRCEIVSNMAHGLCLPCARQDKWQSRCEHAKLRKPVPLKDPFMQG
ncbi:hypothetical protein LTR17_012973 [Elasticomyces elasticus]|nr:hypothetical protein LTR17_012973 [Elasticomyces elasticus]